jgi:prepilin-type N-terminal cleavage/methylation domain-containing protein
MLTRRSRQGFTLIEMMIATGMSLIVSGALYQLLTTTQRLARAQVEHLTVQATVRDAILVLLNEFRELNVSAASEPERNDVLSATATAVTYRAIRGFGALCQPSTSTQLRLAQTGFSAARDPQPGRDSALVFVEGNAVTDTDDLWLQVAIVGVSTAASCAGTLGSGITLTLLPTPSLSGLSAGTPVRIIEPMELKVYHSEGKAWLGMRSLSTGEAIQPVAGPLSGAGLALEYLDHNGHPTADRFSLTSIKIGISATVDQADATRLDAATTLRNAPRP